MPSSPKISILRCVSIKYGGPTGHLFARQTVGMEHVCMYGVLYGVCRHKLLGFTLPSKAATQAWQVVRFNFSLVRRGCSFAGNRFSSFNTPHSGSHHYYSIIAVVNVLQLLRMYDVCKRRRRRRFHGRVHYSSPSRNVRQDETGGF